MMEPFILDGVPLLHHCEANPETSGQARSIFVAPENLVEAVQRMDDARYHIEDISTFDAIEGFVVNYHFQRFDAPGRVTIRVLAPHDDPRVPSIANIYNGADWHERESFDFFGIIFEGHPNLLPLLLHEDMKERPLIKDQGKRLAVRELVPQGETIFKDPAFELLDGDETGQGQAVPDGEG